VNERSRGVKLLSYAVALAGLLVFGLAFGTALAQEAAPAETKSVWDGVYTEEQAKRGEPLYHKQCAACHGQMLTGGESAPPLTGGAFLSNWNGLTLGDLFDRIRKTMPQNAPGKLSRQENADILAYALSVNKFPAGKTELSRQTEFLKEIRFEAMKPEPKK
jgi:mono/diheme cytochrome c family protein